MKVVELDTNQDKHDEQCRDVLKQARLNFDKKFRAIAVIALTKDGHIFTDHHLSEGADVFSLVGGLQSMSYTLLNTFTVRQTTPPGKKT